METFPDASDTIIVMHHGGVRNLLLVKLLHENGKSVLFASLPAFSLSNYSVLKANKNALLDQALVKLL